MHEQNYLKRYLAKLTYTWYQIQVSSKAPLGIGLAELMKHVCQIAEYISTPRRSLYFVYAHGRRGDRLELACT